MLTFRNYMTCRSKCVPMDIRNSSSPRTMDTPFAFVPDMLRCMDVCICMQMHADACKHVRYSSSWWTLCRCAHVSTMLTRMIHEHVRRNRDPLLLRVTRRAPELELLVSGFRFGLGISANRNECSEAACLRSSPCAQASPASLRFLRLRPPDHRQH